MGEPDALAGLVLRAGTTKQVEDALVIFRVDAAAGVGDFEDGEAELRTGGDVDLARDTRLEIFQRIVEQVGENLFDCETIADNGGAGVYLFASGGGATQVVTLTTTLPANQIVNNAGHGVVLSGAVNSHQTFNANSTLPAGTGPNVISGNLAPQYLLAGAGFTTQVFNK